MAIAHDAQTRFPATDITGVDVTTGDRTFTHTPIGTPAGVVVVVNAVGTVAPCSGVLYAGISMATTAQATDTAEAGIVQIYTLTDVAIPTGPAIVTLQNCIAAAKFVTCSTVTSDTGLSEKVGTGVRQTVSTADPTVNITTTKESLIYGGMHGGATAPSLYSSGTGYTTQFGADFGALSGKTQRSTNPMAAGTFAYNFTYATVDDYCVAATAIAEKVSTEKFGSISSPFTFGKSVSGILGTFGQIAFPIVLDRYVDGFVSGGSTTYFGTLSLPVTFGKSVSGIIVPPKSTSVAEIGFPPYGTPPVRTNHSIKFRARTTTGSTGVLKAALYEGTTNRSGDLTSSVLTNSLAEYTLPIPEAAAETITDYSNLSVRFWGYDPAGNALEFEVSEVYLELPSTVVTHFGAFSLPVTFGESVSGRKESFGQIVSPFTFVESTSGVRTTLSQIAASFALNRETNGRKETFGQIERPINIVFSVVAETQGVRYGRTSMSLVFDKDVKAIKETFGQVSSPYLFERSTQSGRVETFGRSSLPIDLVVDVNTGRVEVFSSLDLELLIGLETAGMVRPTEIILNLAKAIYLGSTPVDAVYVDSQKVWSK